MVSKGLPSQAEVPLAKVFISLAEGELEQGEGS